MKIPCLVLALLGLFLPTLAGLDAETKADTTVLTPGFADFLVAMKNDPGPQGQLTAEFLDFCSRETQARDFLDNCVQDARSLGGLGYFDLGMDLEGVLFLVLDLGVVAGGLIATDALLPQALQAANLDWFGSSLEDIGSSWESQSVLDLLPAAAMLAGTAIIRSLLLEFEAQDVRLQGEKKIRQGELVFPSLGAHTLDYTYEANWVSQLLLDSQAASAQVPGQVGTTDGSD